MSYTITEDGNSLSSCAGYVVTGYLDAFPKKLKDEKGIEPTVLDFMEELSKVQDKLKELNILGGVGQIERGHNGTVHFQGYFQFINKVKFSTFTRKLRKAGIKMNWSLQEAQASKQKNFDYCTKPTGDWTYASGLVKYSEQMSEPIYWNVDKMKNIQGKKQRNGLTQVNQAIDEGMNIEEIAEKFPNEFVRNYRGIQRRIFIREQKKAKKADTTRNCFFLYGSAGTGKTTSVTEGEFAKHYGWTKEDVFIIDASVGKLWFDGYAGEPVLLLDDLTPNQLGHSSLCRLLGNEIYRGEIKQGHIFGMWRYVFITSNYTPEELFLRKHEYFEENEQGFKMKVTEYVIDDAVIDRFDFIKDYSGNPNYRRQAKKQVRLEANAKSVASLLPATLDFGTFSDKGQCGSLRVQPSTNDEQNDNEVSESEAKKESLHDRKNDKNFGTFSNENGTISEKDATFSKGRLV